MTNPTPSAQAPADVEAIAAYARSIGFRDVRCTPAVNGCSQQCKICVTQAMLFDLIDEIRQLRAQVDTLKAEAVAAGVLCYVNRPWAYFTTQALAKQWGDDWNDAPYEHNAGRPYEPCRLAHTIRTNVRDKRVVRGLRTDERGNEWVEVSDYTEDGTPGWTITRIAYDGPFQTPGERANGNSAYSVQDINAGAVAWLASENGYQSIMAGVDVASFCQLVEQAGGRFYLPRRGAP